MQLDQQGSSKDTSWEVNYAKMRAVGQKYTPADAHDLQPLGYTINFIKEELICA